MIVSSVHEKGGQGKTSVAVNIAALAATQHLRGADKLDVLLVDTDPNKSAHIWSKNRLASGVEPDIPIVHISTPETLPTALANFAKKHDLIVVDAGAGAYSTLLRAACMSDVVLVPVTPGAYEEEQTFNLFNSFRHLDAKHKDGRIPAYAVLNMISHHSVSGPKQIENMRAKLAEHDVPVLTTVLRDRAAWERCGREGRGVTELPGRNARDAAAEMQALFDEFVAIATGG